MRERPFEIVNQAVSRQGSDAWKKWRHEKIGASDVAAIMGLDPYCTPRQKFDQKIMGKDIPSNGAMERGKDYEEKTRAHLNESEESFVWSPEVVQSLVYPRLIASLDGYRELADGTVEAIEIKAPNKKVVKYAREVGVPDHYEPQLQMQMYILGIDWMWLHVADAEGVVSIKVRRDDDYIHAMLPKVLKFIERLDNLDPPPMSEKESIKDQGIKELTDEECIGWAREIAILTAGVKMNEAMIKTLKERLIKVADHPSIRVGGISLSKSLCKGRIDYDKIPELKTVDLEAYRGEPIEKWTVLIDKN